MLPAPSRWVLPVGLDPLSTFVVVHVGKCSFPGLECSSLGLFPASFHFVGWRGDLGVSEVHSKLVEFLVVLGIFSEELVDSFVCHPDSVPGPDFWDVGSSID